MKVRERGQLSINMLTSILALGTSLAINFFLSPFIVKNLGEEANGFVQLANSFVTYASILTVALNSMAARFISISYHQGEREKARKYYSSVIAGNLLITAILAPIVVYFLNNVGRFINILSVSVYHVRLLFIFVFCNFFATLVYSLFNIATYITNKLYLQNIINLIRVILNAVILLLVFKFLETRIYYVSLIAWVVSMISIPVAYILKNMLVPDFYFAWSDVSVSSIRTLVKSGVWNAVNQSGNLLMSGFDLLLANLYIGPGQMGVMALAKMIPNFITQFITTIVTNFLPPLTISYAGGDSDGFVTRVRSYMKLSSAIISLPIVLFCAYSFEFYALWVPTLDATELSVLSIITCVVFVPLAGTQVLYNVLTVLNKLSLNSLSVLVGGVLNVVSVLLLLRFTDLGMYAIVVMSTLISLVRNLMLVLPYTARVLSLPWYTFYDNVLYSLVCSTVVLVCSLLTKLAIPCQGWVGLFSSIFVAAIFSTVMLFLIVLDKKNKERILEGIIRRSNNG